MKIIDESGRVFGKINIIDLLILSCFIMLMVASIVYYKEYKSRPVKPEMVLKNVTVMTGYTHTYGSKGNDTVNYITEQWRIEERKVLKNAANE